MSSASNPSRSAAAVEPPRGIERVSPSRWLRISAWASFALNVTIIATGGAVRLTGSGLGCPQWPLCAPGSLVPTEELSYHSLIEFGNRTISGPILLFAVLVAILSWRLRAERRDLTVLSSIVLVLVLLQALVGGVIVWMHLDANLVGFHYIVSLLLVCITAAYLVRLHEPPLPRERAVPKPFAVLAHVATLFMAITVFVGVLTTGAGPHSGDANIARDGFDASLLAHIHAWPGYILFGLTLALVVWASRSRLRPLAWLAALIAVELVQIAVGVYQARSGLPPLAVGVHMVLASLAAASMTVVVLRLKRPVAVPPEA
ncbi:MAG: COX15/CtaA family protein [Leucobacter sp.]